MAFKLGTHFGKKLLHQLEKTFSSVNLWEIVNYVYSSKLHVFSYFHTEYHVSFIFLEDL